MPSFLCYASRREQEGKRAGVSHINLEEFRRGVCDLQAKRTMNSFCLSSATHSLPTLSALSLPRFPPPPSSPRLLTPLPQSNNPPVLWSAAAGDPTCSRGAQFGFEGQLERGQSRHMPNVNVPRSRRHNAW